MKGDHASEAVLRTVCLRFGLFNFRILTINNSWAASFAREQLIRDVDADVIASRINSRLLLVIFVWMCILVLHSFAVL